MQITTADLLSKRPTKMAQNSTPRQAEFFLAPNFQGRGLRVLVLVGPKWTQVMRRHYGVIGASFYSRPALSIEPDTDERQHPWGWVYTPKDLLLEEARWSPPDTIALLKTRLEAAIEQTSTQEIYA